MGFHEEFSEDLISSGRKGRPKVAIFVSPAQVEQVRACAGALSRFQSDVHPYVSGVPISAELLGDAGVAIVEVRAERASSVDDIVALVRQRPELPIIAAVDAPEMPVVRKLLREGVADVVSLPLVGDELAQAVSEAFKRKARLTQDVRLAPLVAVMGATGGCGSTTLATHLAHALTELGKPARKVVLVDADLQCGSVAAYLDVNRGGSLLDLAAASSRLDDELLRQLAIETSDGLAVLSASRQIEPLDSVDGNQLFDAVDKLRQSFDLVVVDLPRAWMNWSASLAHAANCFLLVTELGLTGFRQTRRTLDLLDVLGVARDRIGVIANKVRKRPFRPVVLGDLERISGCEALGVLPDVDDALVRAQDQGVLLDAVQRKNPYSKAVEALAGEVDAMISRSDAP